MKTTDEIASERLNICNKCPEYKDGLCSKCGCVMVLKVMLKSSKCPDDKWGVYETPSKES